MSHTKCEQCHSEICCCELWEMVRPMPAGSAYSLMPDETRQAIVRMPYPGVKRVDSDLAA